ncbi:hypothetical protein AUP68_12608 [Ilyonectria robusta]
MLEAARGPETDRLWSGQHLGSVLPSASWLNQLANWGEPILTPVSHCHNSQQPSIHPSTVLSAHLLQHPLRCAALRAALYFRRWCGARWICGSPGETKKLNAAVHGSMNRGTLLEIRASKTTRLLLVSHDAQLQVQPRIVRLGARPPRFRSPPTPGPPPPILLGPRCHCDCAHVHHQPARR